MYIVPQTQLKVRLIGNDDSVSVYKNYQAFIEDTSYYFVERNVVTTFKDWSLEWTIRWFGTVDKPPRYIVRDVFGSVFSTSEILNDIRVHTIYEHRGEYNRKYDFVFRATPVPRTGKRIWRFKNYYKSPKTTQERRWSCAHGKYVRGKRRAHVLPTVWDDKLRGDFHSRECWKNLKKRKQWM